MTKQNKKCFHPFVSPYFSMKILQLSPQFPFPLTDGGKISIANMTRALVSSSCEVHILCMVHTMPTQEEIQRFEEYSGAQCICIVNNTRNTPLAILKSLFDFHAPLYIRKHRSSAFTDEIDRYLLEHTFDAILCDHTAMAESGIFASKQSGLPCIVRMHNIEYVIWKRYAERLSRLDPRRWYMEKQARVLRTMEIELSKNIHHLAMITQNDVEHIQSLSTHISASYIPVGIDTELFKPNTVMASSTRMIHATTYDWIHNVEALEWFITEILPEMRSRYSAELVLLGKQMPEHFRNSTIPGLIGKGFVDDINAELQLAGIYIAPLFVGGGIRIKILEAMSAGLPVIASPVSAEGILAKREDGLIICSSKEEWILEISRLMMNPELASELGNKARTFVKQYHSWEHSASLLKQVIQTLIA